MDTNKQNNQAVQKVWTSNGTYTMTHDVRPSNKTSIPSKPITPTAKGSTSWATHGTTK